jgi:DNA-binding PadR family transcriptional regulator
VEQATLAMLAASEQPMTAVEIREALAADVDRVPAVGSFYNTLKRLESKVLVVSAQLLPLRVRGGRRRQIYMITDAGLEALCDVERFSTQLKRSTRRCAKG